MRSRSNHLLRAGMLIGILALPSTAAMAQIAPQGTDLLDDLAFTSPRLEAGPSLEPLADLQALVSPEVRNGWGSFRLDAPGEWTAFVDKRNGRIESIEGAGIAWLPGRGNGLTRADIAQHLRGRSDVDLPAVESLARGFLPRVAALLGVQPASLVLNQGRSGRVADHLWIADFDVLSDGLPIEGARVVFRVNNGNLVQFGTENLPAPGSKASKATVTRESALAIVSAYLGGFHSTDTFLDGGSLHALPVAVEDNRFADGFALGQGRGLLNVWQFLFRRDGSAGTWRARVDAATGEMLELRDLNQYGQYGQVTGGVFMESPTVGPEVIRPMPFANVPPMGFTNSAGIFPYNGTAVSSTLSGTYVRILDNCGAISLGSDAKGNVAFGTSPASDCSTPGYGGAGNTRASRTQFYHLNRTKEVARGWLTSNAWLGQQLTANVNIPQTCNAFWNGSTVNFYRSGGGCGNTGEIAAVSLHEYGHGLDSNDGNGSSADMGTGETYGDFTAALATHNSCIGPGFWASNCSGYGDACTSCTGIRDIDWARHASATPHTVANFTQSRCWASGYSGPCGREGHCESYVSSEALWDLAARDLPSPGSGSAWAIVDRLWYLSRSTATSAFVCNTANWTSHGCATGSYWRAMRAVDDDDGNLANGTPHSCNLYAAFNRHGIACTTDAGANTCFAGCTAPARPTLSAIPGANQVALSWTNSGAGVVYDVYRNEVGCNAGFIKVANDVAATSFTDTGVAGGSTYYYQLVAQPTGNEACAAAPTTCIAVSTPKYYQCTVDVAGGSNTCFQNVVTVTSTSGNQRTARVDTSGFARLDVFADLCTPSGFTLHIADSPTSDGYGGDYGTTSHDAETHLTGTTFEMYGADPGDLVVRERNAIPASGCFRVQYSILEDTVLFDNDGNPADAPKIFLDAYDGFELAPYAEADVEDPAGADANFWYVGLNRTVYDAGRPGTGLSKACFVLSTTTSPDPATLSSLCP